jgi:DNA-binding Lrp family transcriptional regulator
MTLEGAEMDDLDRGLIRALRKDARAPLSSLSVLLGVSRATIRARIDRLHQSGEIVGFTVLLKGDVAHDPVRGLMMLGIEGRGAERIKRQLAGLPQVQAVHATNGRWDLIVELGTETLTQLDGVLNTIRRFDGVTTSETNLLLSTTKSGG